MGKSKEQKQQQQINLQVAQQQAAAAQQAAATQAALLAQQQQIYGQISPYATSLLNIGQQAANGQVPQAFVNAYLTPARNQFASDTSQASQNLVDALGSAGQWGSGVSYAPLAGFQAGAARSAADLTANANLTALQNALSLGTAGANILQGQQGVFNPVPYGQLGTGAASTALVDPRQYARAGGGILGSILGGGVSALTGGLMGGGGGSSSLGSLPISTTYSGSLNNYNPYSPYYGIYGS